jgi:hypothetical protein
MADKEPLIVPPEEAPPLKTTEISTKPSGRGLIGAVLTVLAIIVVAVLLVFAGRWLYHKAHHHNVYVQPANTKQLPPEPSTSNGQSGAKPVGSNNKTNNSSSNSSQSNNLPNSGPGDVAAIFAGSTAAAGGLHYLVNYRKAKN